jgi:hypothetical protein
MAAAVCRATGRRSHNRCVPVTRCAKAAKRRAEVELSEPINTTKVVMCQLHICRQNVMFVPSSSHKSMKELYFVMCLESLFQCICKQPMHMFYFVFTQVVLSCCIVMLEVAVKYPRSLLFVPPL